MASIEKFLQDNGVVVLDGALATELENKGLDLNDRLWSAKALAENPEVIKQVHFEYFQAGACIATTASYQASIKGLQEAGYSNDEAREIIRKSVDLAKQARDDILIQDLNRKCFVAGSVGPYGAYLANGAEYRGDYDLPMEEMKNFHRSRIEVLLECGVDVLALETIPSYAEAEALLSLLSEYPRAKAWLSFTLRDAKHISNGTALIKVTELLQESNQIIAFGINCVPLELVSSALDEIVATQNQLPIIVYPNSGETYDPQNKIWSGDNATGFEIHDLVQDWYGKGARIIGGCCRTTPDTIRSVATTLESMINDDV